MLPQALLGNLRGSQHLENQIKEGDDVKSVNLADIEKVHHALLFGLGE